MSYIKKTLTGMFWTTALRVIVRIILLLKTAILARLLLPVQFGVFGVATLALSLLEILTETGINVFLLQDKEDISVYVDTAWIVSIARGIIISCLIILSAPWVAEFFRLPDSLPLLYLAAIIPFIRGFINPASVRFQKDLHFHKEFYFRSVLTIIEVASTIVITLISYSPSGLVWGLIISSLAEVVLSFLIVSPRPHLAFNLDQLKEIIHRGKWVTGFGILDFLYTQGDNIVVGRLLGGASLGIYQNAYKISTVPLTEIMDIYYKVNFPTFSKLHRENSLVKSDIYKSVIGLLSLLIFLGLLIFFFAGPIVNIILGPNWSAAIPIVRVLAFLGVARGISLSFNSLFLAFQQQKIVTYIILVNALGLGLTIIPAVHFYGLIGAGYSALFGALIAIPFALFHIHRLVKKI